VIKWPYFSLPLDKPRSTPITNPEMLKKIDLAYQQVCTSCNTFHTCSMARDRHICEGRPLLECSIVKRRIVPTITLELNQPVKLCCPDPSCHHEIAPTKCRSCGAQCPCHEWEVAGKQQGASS